MLLNIKINGLTDKIITMKQVYMLFIFMLFFINGTHISAQAIWTGPTTTFTKASGADWALEVNQDRITNNVWITRANGGAIFNIVSEADYTAFTSPSDTEWAFGTTANIGSLTFQKWRPTNAKNRPTLNQDMVLHLITDNIYIDIKFTFWEDGGASASRGFSYERSTNQALSTNSFELDKKVKLYPNPSLEFIQISGLISEEHFTIYNLIGSEIKSGTISNTEEIQVGNFTNGMYFLKFDSGTTLKFMKK